MLKFLKTTVLPTHAEEITTVAEAKEEALEAEETVIQEAEIVTGLHAATEAHAAKVVLEVKNVRTEEVLLMTEHQETKDAAAQLLVVLTQAHQEKEDQEEANSFC